jgi:hypothetical protein
MDEGPAVEDSLDADWKILRRGYDVTKTMNLAEGMERLTRALTTFFYDEGVFKRFLGGEAAEKPPHKFNIYLIQEPRQKGSQSLVWRFKIEGIDGITVFLKVNQSPFFNDIDQAFEWLFNQVIAAFQQYETEFEERVEREEAKLTEMKDRLMRFKKLQQEMGQFDINAPPLPFETGSDPKDAVI